MVIEGHGLRFRIKHTAGAQEASRFSILSVVDDVDHKRHKSNPFAEKYMQLTLTPFELNLHKEREAPVSRDDVEAASTNVRVRAELITSMKDCLAKQTAAAMKLLTSTKKASGKCQSAQVEKERRGVDGSDKNEEFDVSSCIRDALASAVGEMAACSHFAPEGSGFTFDLQKETSNILEHLRRTVLDEDPKEDDEEGLEKCDCCTLDLSQYKSFVPELREFVFTSDSTSQDGPMQEDLQPIDFICASVFGEKHQPNEEPEEERPPSPKVLRTSARKPVDCDDIELDDGDLAEIDRLIQQHQAVTGSRKSSSLVSAATKSAVVETDQRSFQKSFNVEAPHSSSGQRHLPTQSEPPDTPKLPRTMGTKGLLLGLQTTLHNSMQPKAKQVSAPKEHFRVTLKLGDASCLMGLKETRSSRLESDPEKLLLPPPQQHQEGKKPARETSTILHILNGELPVNADVFYFSTFRDGWNIVQHKALAHSNPVLIPGAFIFSSEEYQNIEREYEKFAEDDMFYGYDGDAHMNCTEWLKSPEAASEQQPKIPCETSPCPSKSGPVRRDQEQEVPVDIQGKKDAWDQSGWASSLPVANMGSSQIHNYEHASPRPLRKREAFKAPLLRPGQGTQPEVRTQAGGAAEVSEDFPGPSSLQDALEPRLAALTSSPVAREEVAPEALAGSGKDPSSSVTPQPSMAKGSVEEIVPPSPLQHPQPEASLPVPPEAAEEQLTLMNVTCVASKSVKRKRPGLEELCNLVLQRRETESQGHFMTAKATIAIGSALRSLPNLSKEPVNIRDLRRLSAAGLKDVVSLPRFFVALLHLVHNHNTSTSGQMHEISTGGCNLLLVPPSTGLLVDLLISACPRTSLSLSLTCSE